MSAMMIPSLLDTDLYKFTMMQVALHHFPSAMVEYAFKCRTPDVDLIPLAKNIEKAVDALCQLRFQKDELDYLRQFSFFKPDFIEFLRIFQLNRDFIQIKTEPEFDIVIQGPWLHTILFEVPVLAIVSEIYARAHQDAQMFTVGQQRLKDKIAFVKQQVPEKGFSFSEFGTRRRFSFDWQEQVIATLKEGLNGYLSGTSNVYFAKKFGIKPMGTMAHEYLQACQALGPRLLYSQRFAFEKWAQEYRGDLGIALSDTYGLKAFLNDFDLYFCKLFDGARQDSGDPEIWGEEVIAHYQKLGVDSRTKTLVFSDALDFNRAIDLYRRFKDRAHPVFGIGTNLTNDLGHPALEIVIKIIECNGQPVAKVSDSPGKTMCRDESYLKYLKQVFHIE